MMTLDHLVTQLLALETRYYDLLSTHQELIHAHETVKSKQQADEDFIVWLANKVPEWDAYQDAYEDRD